MALSAPRPRAPLGALLNRPPAPLVGGLLLGAAGGLAVATLGPLLPLLLLGAAAGAALVLVEPRWGLLGALGVIALLPYGTLPFKVGLTPTLLSLAILATGAVFALRLLLRREERFVATLLDGPLLLFLVVTLFAFVLGLGAATPRRPSTTTPRCSWRSPSSSC